MNLFFGKPGIFIPGFLYIGTVKKRENWVIKPETIRKILVVQIRAIGDVLLTVPALTALRRAFPEAELNLLTDPVVGQLLEGLDCLDGLIPFPANFGLRKKISLFRQIRESEYDLVIDYQGTPGTAQIVWFSGALLRLGWKMQRRQWAYNLYSQANRQRDYVARQKCNALKELGINAPLSPLRVHLKAEWVAAARQYLDSLNLKPTALKINLTPLGKRQARTYPAEKMAALTRLLVNEWGAEVFYNFMPNERSYAEEVARQAGVKVHLLPEWPLTTFAAYLSLVDLHISYDNGPKHLAIALNTPTVALFATDPPELWHPPSSENHKAVVSTVPCRFCGLRECQLMVCVKQIEPRQIMAAAGEIPVIQNYLTQGRK